MIYGWKTIDVCFALLKTRLVWIYTQILMSILIQMFSVRTLILVLNHIIYHVNFNAENKREANNQKTVCRKHIKVTVYLKIIK